jgi:hypothetical protein
MRCWRDGTRSTSSNTQMLCCGMEALSPPQTTNSSTTSPATMFATSKSESYPSSNELIQCSTARAGRPRCCRKTCSESEDARSPDGLPPCAEGRNSRVPLRHWASRILAADTAGLQGRSFRGCLSIEAPTNPHRLLRRPERQTHVWNKAFGAASRTSVHSQSSSRRMRDLLQHLWLYSSWPTP